MSCPCPGRSPENLAQNMALWYRHFWILKWIYIYINTVFEDISTSIYDGNILGRFRMLSGIDIGGIIIVMIIMKPLHNWLTPW